ncbi:MAG: MSMEG_4193 family putative phosphomutase [Nitriliruptorales bacterium]|nr:MSMEG_4193 family putative phosphomutase [Nitriliruptorales bacterium]
MTTLLLIRHATTAATGQRLGGRTEASLDEKGRGQAEAMAERLAGVPLKAIYSSPLARTMETAKYVAAPHGLDVQPVDGLLEVEYGRWTDRPLRSLVKTRLWPVIQARPSLVRFPDGETIREAQVRAVDALEELVARHRRATIAAVTHADVIKAVVAFYLGQPLDLFQRLVISPASVTIMSLGPGAQPALLRFNDDGPLTRERFGRPRKPSRRSRERKARPRG